jgi:hypothetical protein
MSLEDAFADLLEVAKHRGELDREAVRKATTVLAWPRYAGSLDPAGLLVEDLKRVIDGVADGPGDDDEAGDDGNDQVADKSLHAYARRYFSQEAPGTNFTHRRMLAGNPGGGARRWMSAGVIYRVLAGLLELQVDEAPAKLRALRDQAPSEVLSGPGYRIDRVRVLRTVHEQPMSARDQLEYELSLLADGPHLLVLPYPFQYMTLVAAASTHPSGPPKPQLVKLAGDREPIAAVAFGAHQEAGERVQIQVEHAPPSRWWRSPETGLYPYRSSFRVDTPVGNLTLQLHSDAVLQPKYEWEVTRHGPMTSDQATVAKPATSIWSRDNPEVGNVYTLTTVETSQQLTKSM